MSSRTREAYVNWNAGICRVIASSSQETIATSKHFRRATRRARNIGFDVRVFWSGYGSPPRDATNVSTGSYVLPGRRK